jgi:molybdenum-dependent DNA-binding transcriptional regulator ModE
MSEKERDALVVLERVRRNEITMAEATRLMGISYRQCWRRLRRYEEEGAQGLTHRLRGGGGNRSILQEVKERIAGLYRGRYEGFGPVLFAEKLEAEHEIRVDHETIRRLLIKEGLWTATRKRKKRHKAWRQRRLHFGEMVQMDGSHHHWYEDRGPKCCLMVMIDDATGIRMSLLSEEETTEAAMRLLKMWIERYGVPKSLYTDKKNVYVACEKDQENARLAGSEALTQFGRSCRKLGVTIVRAHSPQAKGRVERSNAVYQDRLVKELRLKGISDIERANELLTSGFDDDLNRRFAVEPGETSDYHRSAAGLDLSGIFCIEHERTLSINWTLSFENRLYQLASSSQNYSPAKRKVLVRRYLDGSLHMFYRGEEVCFEEFDPGLARKPKTPRRERSLAASGKPPLPSPNHPWKTAWSTKQLMKQQQEQI